MKKIMFNDRYGLTEAVIKEIKKQTRRLMNNQSGNLTDQIRYTFTGSDLICVLAAFDNGVTERCTYAIGEIVTVAQAYSSFIKPSDLDAVDKLSHTKGWNNKMFVKAYLMPLQIRILDVRAERLQDINEKDCLAEGIREEGYLADGIREEGYPFIGYYIGNGVEYSSAINAFKALINIVCGKTTWERNPYVWRIEFELIK